MTSDIAAALVERRLFRPQPMQVAIMPVVDTIDVNGGIWIVIDSAAMHVTNEDAVLRFLRIILVEKTAAEFFCHKLDKRIQPIMISLQSLSCQKLHLQAAGVGLVPDKDNGFARKFNDQSHVCEQ